MHCPFPDNDGDLLLQTELLGHLGIDLLFTGHQFAQFGTGLEVLGEMALFHELGYSRISQCFLKRIAESLYDVLGGVQRNAETTEDAEGKVLITKFLGGGDVRHGGDALGSQYCKDLCPACLYLHFHFLRGYGHCIDVAAGKSGYGSTAAFEGDVCYFNAGGGGYCRCNEVPDAADAAVAEGDFAWIGFSIGNHLFEGVVRCIGTDGDGGALAVDVAHRDETFVGEVHLGDLRGGDQLGEHGSYTVAVRLVGSTCCIADRGSCTGFVDDVDRLSERVLQDSGHGANEQIGSAACRDRNGDGNGLGGIGCLFRSALCKE